MVTKGMSTLIKKTVKEQIRESHIIVFSKSYCSCCTETKQLLEGRGMEYTAVEIDQHVYGTALQDALQAISGQRTVPNIFIGGKHFGGNDDLQSAATSGLLEHKTGALNRI